MRRFLIYIFFVFVGVGLIDLGNRGLFHYFYTHLPQGSKLRESHSYQFYEGHSPIVVLGASRAQYHYNPQIFKDSMGLDMYNLGMNAQSIFQQYLCFRRALKNGGLKTVILDLAPDQLSTEWHDKTTFFHPYYWNNADVRNVLQGVYGTSYSVKMLSSLIQYNSLQIDFVNMKLGLQQEVGYRGFHYRPTLEDKSGLPHIINDEYDLNPLSLHYLDKMIDQSHREGIDFIVCYSPSLMYDSAFVSEMYVHMDSLSVPFYDFHDMPAVLRDTLFFDGYHMDIEGANLYSMAIAKLVERRQTDALSGLK